MSESQNNSVELKNHFTSTLSYYFATLLSGGDASLLKNVKYVYIYPVSAEELVTRYESTRNINTQGFIEHVASSVVRVSDTVKSEDGLHYTSLICTFNGADYSLNSADNVSLALVCSPYIFVATDLDSEVYSSLKDKLRVDIEWKIGLAQ